MIFESAFAKDRRAWGEFYNPPQAFVSTNYVRFYLLDADAHAGRVEQETSQDFSNQYEHEGAVSQIA